MNDEIFQILDMWYPIPRLLAADFRMNRYHGRPRLRISRHSGHNIGHLAKRLRGLVSAGAISHIPAIFRHTYRHAHKLVGLLRVPHP